MKSLKSKILAWPHFPAAVTAFVLAMVSLFFPAVVFAGLLATLLLLQVRRSSISLGTDLPYRLIMLGFLIRLPVISALGIVSHLRGADVTIFGDSRLVLRVSYYALQAYIGSFGPIEKTHLSPGFYGYSAINWFFGALHYLFGHSPFLALMINVLAILLAGWLVFLITFRITGHRGASSLALGFTVLMPSQIMWSINLLKEPLITLYLALFIYLFVDMIARRRWWHMPILAVMWMPLGHLRSSTNHLALLTLLASSFLFIPRSIWPGIAAMTCGAAAVFLKLGPEKIAELIRSFQTQIVAYQGGIISTGGTVYVVIPERLTRGGAGGGPMTAGETVMTYLKSMYYYLTSPSLLGGLNPIKAAVAPQVLLWLVLLAFFFIPGVLHLWRHHRRSSGIVLVFLLVFTSAMALFTGNEGTAFRQRDILTPFFFIPMSVGLFNVTGWLSEKYRSITALREVARPVADNPREDHDSIS